MSIENIILFRDTLISRMKTLGIKVVSKTDDPKSNAKKRLTLKDLSRMQFNEIESNAKELKKSIDKGEIDEYIISIFRPLCSKAIEALKRNNEDSKKKDEYENMMKDVAKLENEDEVVDEVASSDQIINIAPINNIDTNSELSTNEIVSDDLHQ